MVSCIFRNALKTACFILMKRPLLLGPAALYGCDKLPRWWNDSYWTVQARRFIQLIIQQDYSLDEGYGGGVQWAPKLPQIPKLHPAGLRPAGRASLTIAAGFVCKDGIVMCADSQESLSEFKWPVKKLAIPKNVNMPILITGAGFGIAIDSVADQIFDKVSQTDLGYEGTLREIKGILRDFYEKDYPLIPKENGESVDFNLLFAFRSKDGGGLFRTSGPLIKRVPTFEIIGTGIITNFFAHAHYDKTPWDTPNYRVSQGTVLAAYLVHLARNQVTSIGGNIQMAALMANGDLKLTLEWEAKRWEGFFTLFRDQSHFVMTDCLDPQVSDHDFKERLNAFSLIMKRARQDIEANRRDFDLSAVDVYMNERLDRTDPTPSDSQTSEDQQ